MQNTTYNSKNKKNFKDKKHWVKASMSYPTSSLKFGLNLRKQNKSYIKLDNGRKIWDKKI